MTTWTRRLALLALVVAVLAVAQLVRVHHETGEFRLTPSATPPTIHEFGRTYVRGDDRPATATPRDVREIAVTAGGGKVLGPRPFGVKGPPTISVVPTVLWVRNGSTVWAYALSGGP